MACFLWAKVSNSQKLLFCWISSSFIFSDVRYMNAFSVPVFWYGFPISFPFPDLNQWSCYPLIAGLGPVYGVDDPCLVPSSAKNQFIQCLEWSLTVYTVIDQHISLSPHIDVFDTLTVLRPVDHYVLAESLAVVYICIRAVIHSWPTVAAIP